MRVALLLLAILPPFSLQFLEQAPRTEIPISEVQSTSEPKIVSQVEPTVAEQQPPKKQLSVEEQKFQKVLDVWVELFQNMKSYAFEVQRDEVDTFFGKTRHDLIKVKIMMSFLNDYWVKYEQFDDQSEKQLVVILKNATTNVLDYRTKRLHLYESSHELNKWELIWYARFAPAVMPLLLNSKEELLNHFDIRVRQEDTHYMWLSLIPKTELHQGDFSIIQIGVVKYANQVTPSNFPLIVQVREPGGNETTYQFKLVKINDPDFVQLADFIVNEGDLKNKNWKVSNHKANMLKTKFLQWLFRPNN